MQIKFQNLRKEKIGGTQNKLLNKFISHSNNKKGVFTYLSHKKHLIIEYKQTLMYIRFQSNKMNFKKR